MAHPADIRRIISQEIESLNHQIKKTTDINVRNNLQKDLENLIDTRDEHFEQTKEDAEIFSQSLIGLSFDDAERACEINGFCIRDITKEIVLTMDYCVDRINIEVQNGKVSKICFVG